MEIKKLYVLVCMAFLVTSSQATIVGPGSTISYHIVIHSTDPNEAAELNSGEGIFIGMTEQTLAFLPIQSGPIDFSWTAPKNTDPTNDVFWALIDQGPGGEDGDVTATVTEHVYKPGGKPPEKTPAEQMFYKGSAGMLGLLGLTITTVGQLTVCKTVCIVAGSVINGVAITLGTMDPIDPDYMEIALPVIPPTPELPASTFLDSANTPIFEDLMRQAPS